MPESQDSMSNLSVATSLFSAKRRRAECWNFFERRQGDEKVYCIWPNCRKAYIVKGSTTTPMINHLNAAHPTWNKEEKVDAKQPKLESYFPKKFSMDVFEKLLIEYIILSDHSFGEIEKPQFLKMLKYLKPDLQLFKTDTLKRRIDVLYEEERKRVFDQIRNVKSEASVTTDIWTSPNSHAFSAITVHFIDSDWNLVSSLIDFIPMDCSHTVQNIFDSFVKVMEEVNIVPFAVTLDNASNNDLFIGKLIDHYESFTGESHFRCFAHVLNLVVQSSLKVYVQELAALRIVMKKIHKSPKNRNTLQNLCSALDVPFVAPVLDVPTRWNSTVDMIENALRLKKALLKMKDVLRCLLFY
jgi:hypothetical protein